MSKKGTPTILEEAAAAIDARQASYGSPRQSHTEIAALWEYHLGHPITAEDVAVMCLLMKVARLASGGYHRDSVVDIAGYARVLELLHEDGEGRS